jgi:phosphoglycolate phosphatase
MALLLFDIDGTLLRPVGLGREAFRAAVDELYGVPQGEAFLYDGLLDTQIARRTLDLLGADPTDEAVEALLAAYLEKLAGSPSPGARGLLCAGVVPTLEAARRRGHRTALLTGNLREGAGIKLGMAGIDGYFRTDGPDGPLLGAFARDARERWELVPVAVARCESAFAESFDADRVWLVGDSARDVDAARRAGVRCTAVATGLASYESLQTLAPDLLLRDLVDSAPMWRAVEAGGEA